MRVRKGIAYLGLFALYLAATPSAAGTHAVGHEKPAEPAVRHFPEGFAAPDDDEWDGWELGGFGADWRPGPPPGTPSNPHLPIVLVHGNNVDAATWYPVASYLTEERDWEPQHLWALSYNGVGCTNDGGLYTSNEGYNGWTYQEDREGSDGCVVTSNDVNVPDLKAFIDEVLGYTEASEVHIVAHSLGVTVARKTLFDHPELYERVAGFVAIAGANHGTSFCPPGSEGNVNSCDEIAAGTDWLEELNAGPNGGGEAPGPTRWMTVYDGTGLGDPAFAGPTYAKSPQLRDPDGDVVNCEYPGFYHNDLRVDPRIVADYAAFLTAVEAGDGFPCPDPPLPIPH